MPKGILTAEQRLVQNVSRLKTLNAKLRSRVVSLTQELTVALEGSAAKDKEIASLKAQLEEKELQRKILAGKIFKPATDNPAQKKLGKRPGAAGYSRPEPAPGEVTQETTYTPHYCPQCHSDKLGPAQSTVVKYQEDIEIQPAKLVKKYVITKHWCSYCKEYVRSDKVPGNIYRLPRIGPNVMAYVLYARYRLRLPYNKIQASLKDIHGFAISEGEIAAQLQAAKDLFGADFEAICNLVRETDQVHCDETGWRIGGKRYWIWVYVTPQGTLYKVENTRARDAPQKILGSKEDRVLISDFYSVYFKLPGENQFCWVHLLRDSERVGGQFHKDLKAIFAELKDELGKPLKRRNYDGLGEQLQTVADKQYTGQYVLRITQLQKRIRQTKPQLLTCLKYRDILPENNTAERALRNHVVMRKISGGSRSQAGAKALEVNTSVIDSLSQANPGQGFFDTVLPRLVELRRGE